MPASVVREELIALEQRKRALAARPTAAWTPILHPTNMAEVYREKVLGLRDALTQPDIQTKAADLLRGFVDEIRLTPQDGTLAIAVKGNLAGVLAAADLPAVANGGWLRGGDLNPRPLGYEPNELPDCSTPRHESFESFETFETFESFGTFEPFESFNVTRESAVVKGTTRPKTQACCQNDCEVRTMSLRRMAESVAFATLATAAPVAAQTIPDDFLVTLERTACFGDCHVYTVTIDARGNVAYEGKASVRVTGKANDRVPVARVRELLETIERIGFFTLSEQYREIRNPDGTHTIVTDLPTRFVTVTSEGRTKRVEDYVGAPAGLTQLEREVDAAANTRRWITTMWMSSRRCSSSVSMRTHLTATAVFCRS